MKAVFESLVRTVVPLIVGAVVGFFTSRGIEVDPELAVSLATAITTGAGTVYYGIVRVLEHYVAPQFGWLLGLAREPRYEGKHVAK